MYKKIVFSIGGSILVPDEININFIKNFSKLIKKYRKKIKFSIVVGGGKTSRRYAFAVKNLGMSDKEAHELGIEATHINAKFVSKVINAKFSKESPEKIGKMKELIVSGGYKVGWTTDTDAALIAKSMKADVLINITDVKGVYNKNPKEYPDAKFIPKLNWKDFFKIVGGKIIPSGHYVFDPYAAEICMKNNIKVVVLDSNIQNIENFLNGKKFIGTVIS